VAAITEPDVAIAATSGSGTARFRDVGRNGIRIDRMTRLSWGATRCHKKRGSGANV